MDADEEKTNAESPSATVRALHRVGDYSLMQVEIARKVLSGVSHLQTSIDHEAGISRETRDRLVELLNTAITETKLLRQAVLDQLRETRSAIDAINAVVAATSLAVDDNRGEVKAVKQIAERIKEDTDPKIRRPPPDTEEKDIPTARASWILFYRLGGWAAPKIGRLLYPLVATIGVALGATLNDCASKPVASPTSPLDKGAPWKP